MEYEIESDTAMREFGEKLSSVLVGGEIIELIGDVGAGKTTLVKGLARGLGVDDDIQSPTFTISRVYETKTKGQLVHYDFYRLNDPGILSMEISEALADSGSIVVIEWGGIVEGVLPQEKISISIVAPTEFTREISIKADSALLAKLEELYR